MVGDGWSMGVMVYVLRVILVGTGQVYDWMVSDWFRTTSLILCIHETDAYVTFLTAL